MPIKDNVNNLIIFFNFLKIATPKLTLFNVGDEAEARKHDIQVV